MAEAEHDTDASFVDLNDSEFWIRHIKYTVRRPAGSGTSLLKWLCDELKDRTVVQR
jgi:hypothetical protein